MAKKHKLTVCCGTSCWIAGGDRFDSLKEMIFSRFGDSIEVVPSGCLGQCKKVGNSSNPPFVKFDDIIISEATTDKIVETIGSTVPFSE